MSQSGIALYISEEVVDNGTVDLKFGDSNHDGTSSDEPSCVDVSLQHRRKKRKHGAATGLLVEQQASLSLEPKECQASIALKRAAIETLEALLVVVCLSVFQFGGTKMSGYYFHLGPSW